MFEFSGVRGITPHSLISYTLMVTDTFLEVFKLECLGVKRDISHSLTIIEIYKLNCRIIILMFKN